MYMYSIYSRDQSLLISGINLWIFSLILLKPLSLQMRGLPPLCVRRRWSAGSGLSELTRTCAASGPADIS